MECLYPILGVMARCDNLLYFSCILFMCCVVLAVFCVDDLLCWAL